jgi:DNA-binding NtrC family response regulator
MSSKKITELADQFESLTIKKQMKIVAHKAAKSKLYYREIMEEFEKTLLQSILERYDYNILITSLNIKLHRNTIAKKMKNFRIKEKKLALKEKTK